MKQEDIRNSLLFSKKKAGELNEKFRQATEKYLFIFCNYNPKLPSKSFGDTFNKAVGNRYKLLFDCGKIISDGRIFDQNTLSQDDGRFWENYKQETQIFRSDNSHNNSPENGYIQKQRIDDVYKWFKEKSGKPREELEDSEFESIVENIVDSAKRFETLTYSMIGNIAGSADKQKIIDLCKDQILRFYSSNIYREITKGQMMLLLKEDEDETQKNDERYTERKANEVFQHHLKHRKNHAYCQGNNPKKSFDYYMENYFQKDLKNFMSSYLNDTSIGEHSLLPDGLIQEFVYRMKYPVLKDTKTVIKLDKNSLTKINGKKCFVTAADIQNVMVPVIVNVSRCSDSQINSLINMTDGVECTAKNKISITNVDELSNLGNKFSRDGLQLHGIFHPNIT